ncbi:MAG: lysophospholipid transporter LplT [Gammaproteobacteria bacterium]|nr:lysophospholipid transporter LplT [Gammaproteobacteria bacterium]
MNKHIYFLLIAQFLSAFADNAILFTVIAMVMHSHDLPTWYVPALQSAFLVAFVVLAPWVGGFADTYAKSRVLIIANLIKAVGAGLLLCQIEPLLAYGIVGVGAAVYGPAKYGILPELVGHDSLVRANSWIEGSTILAILLGMLVGAKLADHSVMLALAFTIVLYFASAGTALLLPVRIIKEQSSLLRLLEFGKQIGQFFIARRSRFAILGASLFWSTAAVLRVILVAWAPLILHSQNATDISQLTLFLALGIIAGSAVVPRLIPLEHIRRVRFPAYIMAVLIAGLSFTDHLLTARIALFLIGMAGGVFIVPINATLQELGQQSIGSGSAVAIQNFFQNAAMLVSVGSYTYASANHVDPVMAMQCLAAFLLLFTFLIAIKLPKKKLEQQV